MIRKLITLLMVAGFLANSAKSFAYEYKVNPGDTLTSILYERHGSPMYGKNGRVVFVLKMNPNIQDPDHLTPGSKILIPDDGQWSSYIANYSQSKNRQSSRKHKRTIASTDLPVAQTPLACVALSTSVEDFEPYSEIAIVPKFGFLRVQGNEPATSTTATLLSTLNTGAAFKWTQNWSTKNQTSVAVGFDRVTLEEATNRTLSGASKTLSKFEAGFSRRIGDALKIGLSAGAEQQSYYRAASATVITIDAVPVPYVSGHASLAFMPQSKLTPGVEVSGTYLSPINTSSYRVKAGNAYKGKLYISQQTSNTRLFSNLYYSQSSQKTSLMTLTRTDIGLEVGISFNIGK